MRNAWGPAACKARGGLLLILIAAGPVWCSDVVGLEAGGSSQEEGAAAPKKEPIRSFGPQKDVNYREPERKYVTTNAGPWEVRMESELTEGFPELAKQATERLGVKLQGLATLLPAEALHRLQKLPIYLLLGEESKAGGRDNGGEYFQRHAPDFFPRIDKRWGSSLVIYSARNYMFLSEEWATRLLLHELAHAWHLEQWPESQPDILGAWSHAKELGLYQQVKAVDGSTVEKGYAMVNPLEYFAELSCAFFWRGEYEPFDRDALRAYDPAGFTMLEKIWGTPGSGQKPAFTSRATAAPGG